MADYISREAAKESFLNMDAGSRAPCSTLLTPEEFAEYLDEIPAADVTEVRHGRWEGTADGYADGELVYDMWACSECGFDADGAEEKPEWKYCPNCGAKMDGGGEDAAD